MKNKCKTLIYCAILIVFTQCTPFIYHTGKLVDAEKSDRYYYHGLFIKNIYMLSGGKKPPQKLKNIDIKTFVVLDTYIAKDKNHVFYGATVDIGVDVATFEVIIDGDNRTIRDKNHVYRVRHNRNIPSWFTIIEGANPKIFRQIGNDWGKDDKAVYFRFDTVSADLQTFININQYYSKDKNYLFYLNGKKPEPIQINRERCNTDELILLSEYYIRTNTAMYYLDVDVRLLSIPIKNVASVEMLYGNRWWKVDEKVVFDGIFLNDPRIHESTFVSIDESYFKDDHKLYYWKWRPSTNKDRIQREFLIVIDDADMNTFEQIGGSYAKDNKRAYYRGEVLQDVNPEDFRYDKESNRAYSGQDVYRFGEKVVQR
jgi:hypothetical protein